MDTAGTQALIFASTDDDAQKFRGILHDLYRGDTGISKDATANIGPTPILVDTLGPIHHMITRQMLNSDDLKIRCVDGGEILFARHSKDDPILSPELQLIDDWLPKDFQTIVALSTITEGVAEVFTEVMDDPMTITVYDDEEVVEDV